MPLPDLPAVAPDCTRAAFRYWFAKQAGRMGGRDVAAGRLRSQLVHDPVQVLADAVASIPLTQALEWLDEEEADTNGPVLNRNRLRPTGYGVREQVSVDDVLAVLNEALELDPLAVTNLVEARLPCNDALSEHPTIQCGPSGGTTKHWQVGLLGILNGLFGIFDEDAPEPTGFGPIAAVVAGGYVTRFVRTTPAVSPK